VGNFESYSAKIAYRTGGVSVAIGAAGPICDEVAVVGLRVWIDQDLCTGDGLCMDHVPEVFVLLEDGIAYVREGATVFNDPGQAAGLARVPTRLERAVIEAAERCPGECIFIEVEVARPAAS